jgi:hypothetical protein
MTDSTPWQPDNFYSACLEGDLKKARETITYPSLNQGDTDGNTPLHIVSSKGYTELVQLLFQYHADRTLKNKAGLTAEQMAKDDDIKNLFKGQIRPETDVEHFVDSTNDFVDSTNEVEWFDNCKNAYRIANENREHMKRWLLQVPLKKLLEEIDIGYIDKIEFPNQKCKEQIQDCLKLVIEYEQPIGLICAYNSTGTDFSRILNYDLAKIGSNFRFLSTQNLFNSGYLDNEAPKGLGQHIFAAILINHPIFDPYFKTGTTYRGMSMTRGELEKYKEGDIVLTRSFLSTSEDENVAKLFIPYDGKEKIPAMCIYKVINPRSSLYIEELSIFDSEKEVLIVPFSVFRVTKIDGVGNNENRPVIINLEECDSNIL